MKTSNATVALRIAGLIVFGVLIALACADEGDGSTAKDETTARDVGVGQAGDAGDTGDGGHDDIAPPECEGGTDSADTCRVCVHQGLLQGKLEGSSCEHLGIPYARPPVGALRWAAPEPAEGWSEVRDATEFGPACLQAMDLSGTDQKSEDCLFMNVWTPAPAPTEALPVMVFVHGGGYTGGATNTYSGRGLSESGPVVVASMNYRLGALGFFAHPDLDDERPDRPSGSDAIRDQQLALQWVRDNIASFRGDPDNVTVFGESAGSSSVCIHLVSPESRGLAARFIMESGVCTSGVSNGIEPMPREDMYNLTGQMADDFCSGATDVIDCLRGVAAEDVMFWNPPASADGSAAGLDWGPVIEGPGGVLPEHPDDLIKSDNYNDGEIIVGTNKNEYALFQIIRGGAQNTEELRSRIEQRFADHVEEIMAVYAPSDTADANQAYVTMMTDLMFRCSSRRFARAVTAQGSTVYLYSFEQGAAMHADEMTYVFGQGFYTLGLFAPVPTLLDAVQGYWVNFARNGDPNGEGLVAWPEYDPAGDQHLILADPVSAGSGLQQGACDFWDGYLANL